MVRIIIALLFCFPVALSAQTYQQLSEKAIECIEKDSFHRAEELLLQALKLEPKNAKNALLFSNLGLVQRRLGEYDKALESYSFHELRSLAVPFCSTVPLSTWKRGGRTVLILTIAECLMKTSRIKRLC